QHLGIPLEAASRLFAPLPVIESTPVGLSPEEHLDRARECHLAGELLASIEECDEGMAKDPSEHTLTKLLLRRAASALRTGDLESCEVDSLRAVQIASKNNWPRLEAQAYVQLGNRALHLDGAVVATSFIDLADRCLADCEVGIEHAHVSISRGALAQHAGDSTAALKMYAKALRQLPNTPDGRRARVTTRTQHGALLTRRGKHRAAQDQFHQAIREAETAKLPASFQANTWIEWAKLELDRRPADLNAAQRYAKKAVAVSGDNHLLRFCALGIVLEAAQRAGNPTQPIETQLRRLYPRVGFHRSIPEVARYAKRIGETEPDHPTKET
ncbi:MAG: hypothetical protein GY716_23195, partial [bacterium]|nr:hypothetical protein [bacterium]